MKPTDEQLKTAICVVGNPLNKVYSWGYHSNGFDCLLKHIEYSLDKPIEWWCAYVFIPQSLLLKLTDDVEDSDIFVKCVEITFNEKQENGLYKLGWDYGHYINMSTGNTGTFESVTADIDEVTLFLKELQNQDTSYQSSFGTFDGGQ